MSFRDRLCPVLAATLCLVAAGAGTAAAGTVQPASSAPSLSVNGDLELAPGLEIFHVVTDAQQSDGTTAGQFAGTGELKAGPINLPIPLSIAGPVNCLKVQGSTASFLYEVDSAQPPILNDLVAHKTSVLFTIVKGSNGAPNHIGFVGPLPTSFFHGCAPIGTPFVFNGTVTLSGSATS